MSLYCLVTAAPFPVMESTCGSAIIVPSLSGSLDNNHPARPQNLPADADFPREGRGIFIEPLAQFARGPRPPGRASRLHLSYSEVVAQTSSPIWSVLQPAGPTRGPDRPKHGRLGPLALGDASAGGEGGREGGFVTKYLSTSGLPSVYGAADGAVRTGLTD